MTRFIGPLIQTIPISSTSARVFAISVSASLSYSRDGYILSGHRRYAAARLAGLETVPCRTENVFRVNEVGEVNEHFVSMLREHNRQRVKTFAEKLRKRL